MASVNVKLQDAAIAHSIDLTRYSNGVVRRIIAILNRTDKDLFEQLIAALQKLPAEAFTVERLDSLLTSVRSLNAQAYNQVRMGIESELRQFVDYEANYQQSLFANTLPVQLEVASVSPQQVYSAALSRPFQGKLLTEWAATQEAEKMIRIRDSLRMGYIEGQTIDQMITRIRGTRARQYSDGVIEISRRNAEAVVRTAISHTANHTRQKFYEANNDLIKGIQWISTLDGRTSAICQARDGQIYPVNSGPRPPAHFNCRSSTAPVTKSWKELGIDLPEDDKGTRASMDGQVPEDMTYQQWLKGKDAKDQKFVDEVLGKSKAKLFRAGMPLDRFVNRAGDVLTLDELRAKNAEYFKKAGL
jgi:SPP1 gp7 family putative phage head morphogenesis protein